jgi:sugar phosphate isomerase/epimerase
MKDLMDRVVASATGGDSRKPLDDVLASYSRYGYKNFEVYLSGRGSAFDRTRGAAFYLDKGHVHGLAFPSLHLTPLTDDLDKGVPLAIEEARFAHALGVTVVNYRGESKQAAIQGARPFMAAIAGLAITPVIQLHEGRAIGTLEDVLEVLDGIGDRRFKALLEVGSYHALGITWDKAAKALRDDIGLVHVKDMVGEQSVPFGKGDVDLPGLFAYTKRLGYEGYFVVEIANKDPENTNRYIGDALGYIRDKCR